MVDGEQIRPKPISLSDLAPVCEGMHVLYSVATPRKQDWDHSGENESRQFGCAASPLVKVSWIVTFRRQCRNYRTHLSNVGRGFQWRRAIRILGFAPVECGVRARHRQLVSNLSRALRGERDLPWSLEGLGGGVGSNGCRGWEKRRMEASPSSMLGHG